MSFFTLALIHDGDPTGSIMCTYGFDQTLPGVNKITVAQLATLRSVEVPQSDPDRGDNCAPRP